MMRRRIPAAAGMALTAAAVALSCIISNTYAYRLPSPSLSSYATKGRALQMKQAGDVLVIGGGLAGLSTALELAQRGAKVVVVNRDGGESASLAAGGMLAPQAERLGSGAYLDLCLQSRKMYADWATNVEELSGGMSTGFAAAGGFLAPAFQGDGVDNWVPPPEGGPAYRLDQTQIRGMEPNLADEVVGGWWFPEDMQVDARSLYKTLKEACLRSGVSVLEGAAWDVEALVFHPVSPAIKAVKLRDGRRLEFPKVVVANGAWMNRLLPVPMTPVKGQMLSLRPKKNMPSPLSRVIFAENCYLIPKSDGRLIVGATVEPGVWDQKVTAGGVHELTDRALRICPALGDLEVEETWAGLRPTTPDTLPVLGKTPWENLFVAGGYWRNGVLLAPRTGQLMADVIEGKDQELLKHFRWSRFLPKDGRVAFGEAAADFQSLQGRSPASAAAAAVPSGRSPGPRQTQQRAPTSSRSSPPPSPAAAAAPMVHNDDPYADYVQLSNQVDTEDILREARRQNREGLVGYGLGEDPLGREVASKFNVPSVGMSEEWSVFDKAAQQGLQDVAMYDVESLTDQSHFYKQHGQEQHHHQQQQQQQHAHAQSPFHVGAGAGYEEDEEEDEEDEERESIEDLMARLGYEYENPLTVKIRAREEQKERARRGLTPAGDDEATAAKKKMRESEPDAYELYYSTDVRPAVGWEVVKKRKEQEEQGRRQQQQQQGKEGTSAVHNDDPYADYAQLRDDAEKDAIIREARRKNREGLVGYGLGEDPVGREVASKFNVPSAGLSEDWSKFDDAARQGLRDMDGFTSSSSSSSPSSSRSGRAMTTTATRPAATPAAAHIYEAGEDEEEEEGLSIDEMMAKLGYEYEDPRVAKAKARGEQLQAVNGPPSSTAPTTASTVPRPLPEQQPPSYKTSPSAPPSPPPQPSGPPPPWAHTIEALYQKIRANQAAARRQQGLSPMDGVTLPFKNKPGDFPLDGQGRPRQWTAEEVMEKLEVVRVNPDGSFTKVERGQGLPPPWEPSSSSLPDYEEETEASAAAWASK